MFYCEKQQIYTHIPVNFWQEFYLQIFGFLNETFHARNSYTIQEFWVCSKDTVYIQK